jgi:midasin
VFMERLKRNYADYADLIAPMQLFLHIIKHGLRLSVCAILSDRHAAGGWINTFLALPSDMPANLMVVGQHLIQQSPQTALNGLVVLLGRLNLRERFTKTESSSNWQHAATIFDRLFALWHASEEKAQEEQRALNETIKFRVKTHTMEETTAEDDMSALFPSFTDDWADVEAVAMNGEENDAAVDAQKNVDSNVGSNLFSSEVKVKIAHLHAALVDSTYIAPKPSDAESVLVSQSEFLHDLIQRLPAASLCRLDDVQSADMTAIKMHALQQRLTQTSPASIDFYADSNNSEAVRMLPILRALCDRLEFVSEQWPDHPALIQIKIIADRLLSFPVSSPLMKLLTGLEMLLQKSQDWEEYASREFSLRESLDAVTALIIRWRKLELECWSTLMDRQQRTAQEQIASFWFHLYGSLIAGDGPTTGLL